MRTKKTKACIMASLTLLTMASFMIHDVKASSDRWCQTWHHSSYENYPGYPQNISTTCTVSSPDGNFWVQIALVVSVYEYQTDFGYDCVNFRVNLYFDSFANEELPVPLPVPASFVTFFIEKDASGSNLNDQFISIVTTQLPGPGCSQGRGLDQSTGTSSTTNERKEWVMDTLATAVGLFFEPIDVAMDLISVATAFAPDGEDYENADWADMQALSWWHNPGYDFGFQNPVRQYAFNSIRWFQDPDINPSTYYGIKVSARVGLAFPNPIGDYIDTDPVYLQVYHYSHSPSGGGCPFVYTWNGTGYAIDNNLLGDSEASGGADVEDYYRLEQPLVGKEGKYRLLIKEFEQEHAYLDRVQLTAVDHESDVHVAVTHNGEILTYKHPAAPISAVDNNGTSRLDEVSRIDGDVSDPATYFDGEYGDYVTLDFENVDVGDGAKLVFRGNIEKKIADPGHCIHVQVLDATERWVDIEVVRTREYWSTLIVDLADYLPDANGDLKVRLYLTAIHRLDYVGLDTTKQDDVNLYHANLVSAVHSEEGNVKTQLLESDDLYAELIPDQQIELAFTLPENSKDTRTFITHIEGHYYTID